MLVLTELLSLRRIGAIAPSLPTLPMFIMMPWLIKKLGDFWPALIVGIIITVALYALTMRLLKVAGVNL